MNFLFLLLNLGALFLLSFLALRFKIFKEWQPATIAVGLAGIFQTLIACLYVALHVVSYRSEYMTGVQRFGIPIGEVLLFFTLPYAVVVIYSLMNKTYPLQRRDKFSLSVSNLIMGLSIAMIFFAYSKWYTMITFALLLLLLFYVEYVNKKRFMYPFYRSFLVALVVFLLIGIPLNFLSVVTFSKAQTIELQIAYIPFESYFYFLTVSLITIYLFETLKKKV